MAKKQKGPEWPEWMTYQEAAEALGMAFHTVRNYSRRVFGWTPVYRGKRPTAYIHRDEVARTKAEREAV